MWRYLGVGIMAGLLAAGVVWLLESAGVFDPMASALFGWLGEAGLASAESARWIPQLQVAAYVVLPVCMGMVVMEASRLGHALGILAGLAALTLLAPATLALYDVLFEPFSTLAGLGMSFVFAILVCASQPGRCRRKVSELLGSRVSSKVFRHAIDRTSPARRPAKREVSLVTFRLLNTGELVTCQDPLDVAGAVRDRLRLVRDHLTKSGAWVDESAADSVRGVFGCFEPDGGGGHALRACESVVALLDLLKKRDAEIGGGGDLRCGLSVATGVAVLGGFCPGGAGRERFGVLGDVVEFGRRLAGANRVYGSRALVSSRTHHLAKEDIEVRPMEMLFDPAVNAQVEVYEPLALAGGLGPEACERRDRFWEGVVLMRQGRREQALQRFEAARTDEVSDYPLEYFISKVRTVSSSRNAGDGVDGKPEHALSVDRV